MSVQVSMVGYHGCDLKIARDVASGVVAHLKPSKNKYDWLGHGIYFWEDDCARAHDWAKIVRDHPARFHNSVKFPFVVGALIESKNCLDLTQTESREMLRKVYEETAWAYKTLGWPLPENKPTDTDDAYLRRRELDCLICNTVNQLAREGLHSPFDVIRAPFLEGDSLYEGSAFMDKTHTQICVCDPSCIKGYFIPAEFRDQLR